MNLPFSSATVLGAGSWGTALAALLHERGLEVQFWGRDQALMLEIRSSRRNSRYLPGLHLPQAIQIQSDLSLLKPADLMLFAVPSKGVRHPGAGFLRKGDRAAQRPAHEPDPA
jgi:glycerol-3-phosphate dehydrogenase (NAD(P)+)